MSGTFDFELRDANGAVLERWSVENAMTELGEAWVADRLTDAGQAQMSHMAIGTGTGQTVASTTLANEVGRVALESGYPQHGTGANDNRIDFYAIFPAGTGTGTITEVAVLNASSAGTMMNYASGFVKVKEAGNALNVHLYVRCGVT